MRSGRDRGGFTILELLFAVMICAVLVMTGVIGVRWARNRAMVKLVLEDTRAVAAAAARFRRDVQAIPPEVRRGVDPGLVSKYGWQDGGHSAKWDDIDLSGWNGPYLTEWKRNPWGGLYDWDVFPANYGPWGIPGGGPYLTLKPALWGGKDGLPPEEFEQMLEDIGADRSKQKGVIAFWMGGETAPPAPAD